MVAELVFVLVLVLVLVAVAITLDVIQYVIKTVKKELYYGYVLKKINKTTLLLLGFRPVINELTSLINSTNHTDFPFFRLMQRSEFFLYFGRFLRVLLIHFILYEINMCFSTTFTTC